MIQAWRLLIRGFEVMRYDGAETDAGSKRVDHVPDRGWWIYIGIGVVFEVTPCVPCTPMHSGRATTSDLVGDLDCLVKRGAESWCHCY